jgi:hypothetical protein
MGALLRLADGAITSLSARTLVGRSPSCRIRIDERVVSAEHAKIDWSGSSWRIRDLGSRNGTFLEGKPVPKGMAVLLVEGSRIGFGTMASTHVLSSAAPPEIIASTLDGESIATAKSILVLPSEEKPLVSIYLGPRGWMAEHADGRVDSIADQAIVDVDGRAFRCDLPGPSEETPAVDTDLALDNLFIRFSVRRDEERVEIELVVPGREIRLEAREHGYLLLTLARARLTDANLPPSERGWRDRDGLARDLALLPSAVNVAIHRARKQLEDVGVRDAAGIVEVRRGQRRLGTEKFEIRRI